MSDRSRLELVVFDEQPTTQILLAGDVDLSAGVDLEAAMEQIATDPGVRRLEIDVALVDTCDAGGLKSLVAAALWAADRHVLLYLTQVRPALQAVLDTAGVSGFLSLPE